MVSSYVAEYVWVDSNDKFRSKTRIIHNNHIESCNIIKKYDVSSYPIWYYDGTSTEDAKNVDDTGVSECVLRPVAVYKNAFLYSEEDVIVYCQAFYLDTEDGSMLSDKIQDIPLFTNIEEHLKYVKRLKLNPVNEHFSIARENFESIFKQLDAKIGFNQEFFMINPETNMPFGMITQQKTSCWFMSGIIVLLKHLLFKFGDYVGIEGTQGSYYCSVGYQKATQRKFIDSCMDMARKMGLSVTSFNYEVAPGQAEFKICDYGISACHQLMMMRYILVSNGANYGIKISFDNSAIYNNKFYYSGCNTTFSTSNMRMHSSPDSEKILGFNYILNIIKNFDVSIINNKQEFEEVFGNNVTKYLNGQLETSNWDEFTYGIGTRFTSIRIPLQVARNGIGYLEDRRPGANVNPYAIANWLLDQVYNYEIKALYTLSTESDNTTPETDNETDNTSTETDNEYIDETTYELINETLELVNNL
jgi:glutamine synthetase